MEAKYTPHTEPEFEYESLKPCPLCGKDVDLQFIGNSSTKNRKVKIYCRNCNLQMLQATFQDAEWIAKKVIDRWNKRISVAAIPSWQTNSPDPI